MSRSSGQVAHVLRTRSPLSPGPKPRFSLDLHVLGAPPAFVLSQDQTLHRDLRVIRPPGRGRARKSESCPPASLWPRGNCVRRRRVGSTHGIDMSLRINGFGGLTGFWRSLLCFQEAGPRRTWGTQPHVGVEATRTRPTGDRAGPPPSRCWCQPAPPFRANPPIRRSASGVRGDWQDYRSRAVVSNSVGSERLPPFSASSTDAAILPPQVASSGISRC